MDIINDNINMHFNHIPSFDDNVHLPYINVLINDVCLRAVIDSASIKCVMTYDAVQKCNLNYLLDRQQICNNYGIGTCKTIGKIWYTNITINSSNLPISLDVVDNLSVDFDLILGNNFLKLYCENINFKNSSITIDGQRIDFTI